MHNPPSLSQDELVDKLGELFKPRKDAGGPRWQRTLAAIGGRCEAQTVEVRGQAIRVVPVASEFELRRAMPELHEREPVVFVLGYPAIEVPVDIAGRFMRRGRVAHVGRHERLRRLFSGRGGAETPPVRGGDSLIELDAELVDSALGRALLRAPADADLGLAGGALARVSLDEAYARWLHVAWKTPSQLSLDNLLAFVASSDRHESFLDATDSERAPELAGLREELLEVLARNVAPEAALVWRCWLAGQGRALLEFAVLFEAFEAQPSEALDNVLQFLAAETLGLDEGEYERVRPALAIAAETALELYAERWGSGERHKLLARAEGHVRDRYQVHLRGSRRLPIAWTLRLDAVGEALAGIARASKPSEAEYQALGDCVRELELHEAIRLGEHQSLYEQAEMARRLAAWLVVRSDRRWVRGTDPVAKFEGLALWYAQEGGYLDLARRRIRGAGTGTFKAGVAAVLEAVDAIRAGHDRTFAAGLAKWVERGRPKGRVLAIEDVVGRFGVDYLKSPAAAQVKLLVLVLDGMAWMQAVELLGELGSESAATAWHPLSFNREVAKLDARANFVPVIAGLPTITSVSRSALFGGEPTAAGVEPRSGDDDKRWAAHAEAASLFSGSRAPALLTAREAFDDDGLSAATRTALGDAGQPLVAVLINTIDAALKSDKLDEAPWTITRIRPLRALLDAAREAGRCVLLCSDHGHVPGQRLRYANVRAGAGRWRPWMADDAIQEFEQPIPSPPGWRPPEPGARGIVLINDELHAYTGAPHHGEHGGATLAEVVTPAVLLGNEQLGHGQLGRSHAHEFLPAGPPGWWLDEVRQAEGRKAAIEAEAEKQLAKQRSDAPEPAHPQLSLAVVEPEPSMSPEAAEAQALARAEAEARVEEKAAKSKARGKKWTNVTDATHKLLDKLESNSLFEARASNHALREEVLCALEYLLEHQDRAPAEFFAKWMGKSQRRVAQMVSNLSTVLNVDGYDVLSHDPRSKQVVLDRELLVQSFGL